MPRWITRLFETMKVAWVSHLTDDDLLFLLGWVTPLSWELLDPSCFLFLPWSEATETQQPALSNGANLLRKVACWAVVTAFTATFFTYLKLFPAFLHLYTTSSSNESGSEFGLWARERATHCCIYHKNKKKEKVTKHGILLCAYKKYVTYHLYHQTVKYMQLQPLPMCLCSQWPENRTEQGD